ESPPPPNVIMQNLNQALSQDLISNNCFITLVLACYTPTTRELVYANAGHIYPMHWTVSPNLAENPNYLKVRSIPLGILPKWQALCGQLVLSAGDTLLLASDGITEAMVLKQTQLNKTVAGFVPANYLMLNQEGLWQFLKSEPKPLSLNHLLARIQADNNVQEDDQTILSLEVM
ncbi:MAG: serine/threonine-protein phosphatase, partial [Tolypothrix sp. Co-bin9]|nr:serine/threonine-protein phosphatase [Tolypothrix sp. Co-bin9]